MQGLALMLSGRQFGCIDGAKSIVRTEHATTATAQVLTISHRASCVKMQAIEAAGIESCFENFWPDHDRDEDESP
jgi:hypothetical protein